MPYAIRNTLFIGIFWLLIVAGGLYYIYGVQSKKYTALQADIKKKTSRLNDLQSMQITRHELIVSYNRLRDISLGKLGALAGNESPGETFDYMLRELNKTSSMLELNQELKLQEKFKDFEKTTYNLNGEADFKDVYELIWFLENGPIFYDVRSINIERIGLEGRQNEEKPHGEVFFSMDVWGFRKEKGLGMDEIVRENGNPQPFESIVENSVAEAIDRSVLSRQQKGATSAPAMASSSIRSTNPFSGEMVSERQVNTEGLPEVNAGTLILAITPYSVIIKDNNGKIVKLRKGDRVLGGSVGNINVKAGTVGFFINSSGGSGSLELSLTKN